MLGAILSATDPVAVVALLKELGVSKRFSTLIEGESLLNDGTAMVVFEVFFSMAEGEDMGVSDIVVIFLRLSVGGPLMGLLFSFVMSHWIRRVFDDPVIEIALTFITTYLLFWTCEASGAHVSGILALVTMGLYM
jgi:NhaP-type Na+/H+ or K+/H+ antiporter